MPKKVDEAEILKLYAEGKGMVEIQDITKYSRTTILKHLKLSRKWISRGDKDVDIIHRYTTLQQPIHEIAKEMGVSRNTVANRLVAHNIYKRPSSVNADVVINLYKKGLSITEVADTIGCSAATVSSKLNDNNVLIDNHLIKINDQELIDFYGESKTLVKTAAHFNVSIRTIKNKLVKLGIKSFRSDKWNRSDDAELISMYKEGASAIDIGKMFGTTHTTIYKQLRRLGVHIRKLYTEAKRGSGYEKISDSHFGRIKKAAECRELAFEITRDYIYSLYILQKGLCKLSGVKITLPKNYSGLLNDENTASLDRIDSSKGYIIGNVQWVDKHVNLMKLNMPDLEFIKWCKIITDFNIQNPSE